MTLSDSGEFVSESLAEAGAGYTLQVTPVGGGLASFSETGLSATLAGIPQIRVSPDGRGVAVPATTGPGVGTATQLFRHGVLIGALDGWAVDWLDNEHLLVSQYQQAELALTVRDVQDAKLSTPDLPDLRRIQPVGPDRIYSPEENAIFSLVSGDALWAGSSPALQEQGAVAGPFVVFAAGSTVRAEPH